MFDSFGPIDELDKAIFANQSSAYLDMTLKYLQIVYYTQQIGNDTVSALTEKKIVPMLEILADEMGKATEEYQRKHGEI